MYIYDITNISSVIPVTIILFINRKGQINILEFIPTMFSNSNETHEIYRILSEVSIV
jgi:hypothetical protein